MLLVLKGTWGIGDKVPVDKVFGSTAQREVYRVLGYTHAGTIVLAH